MNAGCGEADALVSSAAAAVGHASSPQAPIDPPAVVRGASGTVDVHGMVAACWRVLEEHLRHGRQPKWCAAEVDLPAFERLDLGLRTYGALRALQSGRGAVAAEQLADAVVRACVETRRGRLVAGDLPALGIELWLLTGQETISVHEREHARDLLQGCCGVVIEWADACAEFKPNVALERSFKHPADLLDVLCEDAGLFPGAWRESACDVRRTHWRHFCGDPSGRSTELRGLRPVESDVPSVASMRNWIDEGVGYLAANQHSDGDYCYIFLPLAGRSTAEKPNTVRSSGCAYAIAQAASVCTPALRATALSSAERAIEGILTRCIAFAGGLVVPESAAGQVIDAKLGSTALLAVATLAPAVRERFREATAALLTSVLSAQDEDGRFRCHFNSTREPGATVNYYPGEALLALAHAAELGNADCLAACRRAFVPYREHFRTAPASAFVGWHVDVWSRLARLDGAHDYAGFAFEQIDWLLPQQSLGDPEGSDYGGFRIAGARANVSSTVYAEATIRAAHLARNLGDAQRWQRYRSAAVAALRFCGRLRLREEQAVLFPHPRRSIGGVTGNGVRFEVRADHVQHLVTMAIAALQTDDLFSPS